MKKRALATLLALVMVVCMLPCAAFAAGGNAEISIGGDCVKIGEADYGDVYYYPTAIAYGTENVEFTDLAGNMEDGMIAGVASNAYVENTNVAPVNDNYAITAFDEDWEIDAEYADFDFTGAYCYWITDADYETYFVIVKVEQASDTFDLAASDCTEIGEYVNGPVYYYSGDIPAEAVNIRFVDFAPESVAMLMGLTAGYLEETNVAPLSGAYNIPDTFAENGFEAGNGYEDFDFSGKYLYCIMDDEYESVSFVVNIPTVDEPEAAFTAIANGEELFVSVAKGAYSCYGVGTDLYTVALPPVLIEKVLLDFGEKEYIATYYDADGEYLGAFTGWTEGVSSIEVPDFDVYIWVQNPYAPDWSSGGDTVFVVCFKPLFTATVAGTEDVLENIIAEKDGYKYTNYLGTEFYGYLYTIAIPFGVEEIDFVFSDNCLAYNYAPTGSHPAAADDSSFLAGMYEDFIAGSDQATRKVDHNNDGVIDYIQVQDTYNADYSGAELRYAITFVYDLFGVFVDGEAMTQITAEEGAYNTYSWGPAPDYALIPGDPVALYTVTIPDGTTAVDLVFPEGVLPYAYESDDGMSWISGSYEGDEMVNGVTSVSMAVDGNDDGEPDYIQVQTPFDADYNSSVLYAITFELRNLNPGGNVEDITAEELRDNIAAKYAASGVADDSNASWLAADMMAYEGLFPDTESKLSAEQKQAVADSAIAEIASATSPNVAARNIVALCAMGFDPRQIVTGEGEPIDGVTKLDELTFAENGELTSGGANIYAIPYILIAYEQFSDTEEQCLALVAAAVEAQESWLDATWGVDGLTPMLLALAPYTQENGVQAALDLALAGLAAAQVEDGSVSDYSGSGNAASTGLAMAGVAALGIDPSEYANASSGKTLKDGIVLYAGEDGASLVPVSNSISTEQGFRGLIAMTGAQDGAYRIYDFSGNIADRIPAEATPSKAGADFTIVPAAATVTVFDSEGQSVAPTAVNDKSFNLDPGSYTYKVEKDGYETATGEFEITEEDAAAAARLAINVTLNAVGPVNTTVTITVKVLAHDADTCGNALTYKNDPDKFFSILDGESHAVTLDRSDATADQALIAALVANDIEYEIRNGYFASIGGYSELDHGPNSGWLFMVDGVASTVSADGYRFINNSEMVFFYTDDFSKDYGSEAWQNDPTEPSQNEPEAPLFSDVPTDHWAYEFVKALAERGIIKGYGDGTYGATDPIARRDIVVILWRLCGEEEAQYSNDFSDVPDGEYYTQAIAWAVKNGIVNGIGNGKFDPTSSVTREQLAVMLYRLAAYKGITLSGEGAPEFTDAADISDYAVVAVAAMAAAGVITGTDEGAFLPQESANRCEAAAMVCRFDALK